jgi:hypothetical protein
MSPDILIEKFLDYNLEGRRIRYFIKTKQLIKYKAKVVVCSEIRILEVYRSHTTTHHNR